MDFNSISDIIQFAIEKEKEAAKFYRTASKNAADDTIKYMLVDYAKEEEKHESILKDLAKDKSKINSYVFVKIQDLKRSDYLVEMEYEPNMSHLDFIRLAMKREEKAHKLYKELAKTAEKQDQAEIFSILSREELKHKSELEKIYDDLMAEQGD
ncbi:ferritin family protein [bacterium]|nr:ferritin family protein [bacterium]